MKTYYNMKIKIIIITSVLIAVFSSCKYDDDYLNPTLESRAYFASGLAYTRTVIVGEGLQFKIGAAASGSIKSPVGETIDMIIDKTTPLDGGKVLMPDEYYNSSELGGTIKASIGDNFLGYFTVKLDSAKFLNDPNSFNGLYTFPVKITGTSLQGINEERNQVQISVKYMSRIDGYYLYKSEIKREINGIITETYSEKYPNESDNSTFRMETQSPFTVKVISATNSSLNTHDFNLTIGEDNSVDFSSLEDGYEITPNGDNSYNRKTRDFILNYKYKIGNDTILHVSQELIFRNRMVDGVNQTRDYLSYFN